MLNEMLNTAIITIWHNGQCRLSASQSLKSVAFSKVHVWLGTHSSGQLIRSGSFESCFKRHLDKGPIVKGRRTWVPSPQAINSPAPLPSKPKP